MTNTTTTRNFRCYDKSGSAVSLEADSAQAAARTFARLFVDANQTVEIYVEDFATCKNEDDAPETLKFRALTAGSELNDNMCDVSIVESCYQI